jgi:CheY-like chemotaxis protein
VHSDGPGRGSEFTVVLPLALESVAADAGGQAGKKVRTVVLVEDQDDARRMMQLLLEAEGVAVTTAGNGLEGAELIERLKPDLALVDLGLPVMSGFDLARRIRKNPAHSGIRLIALSGYGQDSDIRAAIDAGFDQHLTKPPDPERLERVLAGTDRDFAMDPNRGGGGSRAFLK